MKYLIIIFLLLTGCSAMFQPLSRQDVILQLSVNVLTIIDCMQTHDFKREGLSEQNSLMSKYPSDTEIDISCAVGIGAQWLGVYASPKWLRPYIQGIEGATEIKVINHNHNLGARVGG